MWNCLTAHRSRTGRGQRRPTVFLGGVYIPLRRALDEVTWEVRTRDAIRRIIAAESPRAVQTSAVVERHTVALRLRVVGSSERAANLEAALVARIAGAAGVVPMVSAVPVADARVLAASAATDPRRTATTLSAPIGEVSQHLSTALIAPWPAVAGKINAFLKSLR